ncbi:NAD(P)H-dependent glycerol-3-phosphate dehydrogenase [Enorma burkinafasonensis]|uniref:NAD(P)H-dependent glycerol-3-phosphate dehydrogenase n=1 Tax=Enorma burkinafasonensis TaxID=2590867 RepID=UPI0026EB305D|nr:NAD(P)H-dependent glycerol-3-phosphate dehydrogenase [Enorma burkinafasonensis]MCI7731064.1 NAD(P)-dependent glycerol-3-phosphate dehydrogenase [Enorma burkinafasonensis]
MKITVIGAGSWGTAISGVAAAKADEVVLWSHDAPVPDGINREHRNPLYLTDYTLPENVTCTCDFAASLAGTDGIIVVVPSPFIRSTLRAAAPEVPAHVPVLTLTKGIEADTGKLMSDVVIEELGGEERVAALSGPNHAEEICKGSLSAAVIAAAEPAVAEFFKDLLISPSFRIYTSDDMCGIETCGAVKNVIAIVCGIAAGVGYGDNTLALIMTRGLAEISRIVYARGGRPMTCMGLAGMGDLIATCTSPHSRNRTFGLSFAHGESLDEYQARTHMIVEGAVAARSTAQLARSLGVDAPITFALEAALYGDVSMDEALHMLIDRFPTEEFYGLDIETA